MGEPAAALTPTQALDLFLTRYYRLRPVTATFTGVHDYDDKLPDWSANGLEWEYADLRVTRQWLRRAGHVDPELRTTTLRYPDEVDLALADGFLEIQEAEHLSPHFRRGNPCLWLGEAIFSLVSLVTRDFAPEIDRLMAVRSRLLAIPFFLNEARRTLVATPAAWKERAIREAEAGKLLVRGGLIRWIKRVSTDEALTKELIDECLAVGGSFEAFGRWIGEKLPTDDRVSFDDQSGRPLIDLLLRRGHWVDRSAEELLADAHQGLLEARALLDERLGEAECVDWPDAQRRLADLHPTPDGYLARFAEIWERAREAALAHDLVSWPDAPIRYVPIPEHTRDVAPNLYYLFYRSPAAFDGYAIHDYVVTPIDVTMPAEEQERRLRAANDSVITLNHVIHHGGLGHHVQNWHAYRSSSRIGQVAAIDAACRIGMLCGGSLAEGWACYACDVMEEIGFLTPLERVAQQHTRVRSLARAVVDLSMHTGRLSIDEAARFHATQGMMAEAAATAEAVKTSMFPGSAVMYWLGTRGIHDLRARIQEREGAGFSLRRFHDRLLSYGAIPVALISRLMLEDVEAGL